MQGYIYIRNHPAYSIHNGCKLGKANNIPERDSQYATGEIVRGQFTLVIEMSIEVISMVEKLLQNYFNSLGLHIRFDGGTEFYNCSIIQQIVPYLEKTTIKFRVLTKLEIDALVRCYRIKKHIVVSQLLTQMLTPLTQPLTPLTQPLTPLTQPLTLTPRPDQTLIINNSIKYLQTHDKGMLILTCGIGKTLISLWITQQLQLTTLVVGVPNKLLLKQWHNIINILYPNINTLIVSGGVNKCDIKQFLKKYENHCIIITTYSSSHKVKTVTQEIKFKFAMKILDEAHHLTSHNMQLANTGKTYIQMLHIASIKQLSLTATLKQIEGGTNNDGDHDGNNDSNIISNDNVVHFGNIIDQRCLLWAINNNIVCDYLIQTIITNEEQFTSQMKQFNISNENDQRMFLSAYAALKSINEGYSHHLLIYSNNKENSLKLIQYVKLLLEHEYFVLNNLYYSNYHSEMKSKDQKEIINNFEKAKFGIITCVYCLGEGYDNHNIDAVVFAENMASNIRIVQSALRASRKNKIQPNKITKIILPILTKGNWLENNDNPDLKKVREVIYQMGLEDTTIIQKIKVCNIDIKQENGLLHNKGNQFAKDFGTHNDELTQLLRLQTINRSALGTSYEKARKILIDQNIKSKADYLKLCDKDNRLYKDPEVIYKSQFTSWIEYLSIQRIYYELDMCKAKVKEYCAANSNIIANYLDLSAICSELCKLDAQFPPNELWVDYYKVKDLSNIINIVIKKKNKYDILGEK